MKRLSLIFVFVLLCVATPMVIQGQKKDADKEYQRCQGLGDNQADQIRCICSAASMNPKKYQSECTQKDSSLKGDDAKLLHDALDEFKKGNRGDAKLYAKGVSNYSPDLYNRAQELLKQINAPMEAKVDQPKHVEPTDQSEAVFNQAKADWDSNNFDGVKSLSSQITTQPWKDRYNDLLRKIDEYTLHINIGNGLATQNLQAAIDEYKKAESIKPAGPVNTTAKITELQTKLDAQNKLHTEPNPQQNAGGGTSHPFPAPNSDKEAEKARSDADSEMRAGNTGKALVLYEKAHKLQPNDPIAAQKIREIEEKAQTDPLFAKSELMTGIQLFYSSQFDLAKEKLEKYLQSNAARNKGAASFYLGSTILEKAILENRRSENMSSIIRAFKQARSFNYRPVESLIPPKVLTVWKEQGS